MWAPAYEPALDQKRLGTAATSPHSIDLLSIVSISPPETIDRTKYPFAKSKLCFAIASQAENTQIFEASSEQQLVEFVNCLKLAVARLVSKIIVGDVNVIEEFYSPWTIHHLEDVFLDHVVPDEKSSEDSPTMADYANHQQQQATRSSVYNTDIYYPKYDASDVWRGALTIA